ncbi:PREDICTED: proline dehydrogenase 2, mitochondrial-like isoform X1 [Tarenaya hassleriana]|uniref:proline dehydrogenase 2, mitochondrial-like isoform X1 n=1 Tax=Tarenaya hassleriana TaxID=28532 RepID=UPI00053C07F8|nr:PREDICTED: proline dehydrogenase 2, mitochondrial-like isoform X1 [Tarenaya hassleriana]
MATHLLRSPSLLRHLRPSISATPFAGVPSFAASTAVVPEILTFGQPNPDEPEPLQPKHIPDLDLSDEARLFAGVHTAELLRSTAVLHAAAIGPMVDLGSWVMGSKLMDVAATRELFLGVVRRTFYDHFCAGEDAAAAGRRVRRMYEATGLKGMLVYGVEHSDDGGACDDNMQRFLDTVEAARGVPSNYVSSVVVKITAICPIRVLKRVSDLLRWQYKNPNFDLPWKLKSFPVFSGSSPLYHTNSEPEPLTLEEERELENAHERLRTICRECQETNVPLLIDAEDTILQPAIDYMAYWSTILFNSDKSRPVVYNTVQAYLKDSGERLQLALREAEKMGVPVGFKLVRGAYMSSERRLASSLGCKSPVHDSIEETHTCYNTCMSFLLEKAASGSAVGVVLATHNTDSGKLAAKKAKDLGIDIGDRKIEFAQLYGMSDALSLGLKKSGFNVSKYMPFGPVETAIPYLLRRAEENRGMLATTALDRQLMRKELQRRLKAAAIA